jgi:hypothetical protein
MRIPEDSIVPDDKIIRYLLVLQLRNDKSKFLAQAGFTPENSEALKLTIQMQAVVEDAIEERRNEYGIFYQAEGNIIGVNRISLLAITIWLQRESDGKFQFVTLKPSKRETT